MRPTGRFHLGNYLGAGENWVKLQDEYECYYFIADYHALTTEPDGHKVESKIFDLTADLLAVGLDPKRSVIYQQSKVPEVAELSLLLSMVTPLSWVMRTPDLQGAGQEAAGQRQPRPSHLPRPAGRGHRHRQRRRSACRQGPARLTSS